MSDDAGEGFTTEEMTEETGKSGAEIEATQIHNTADTPDDAQTGVFLPGESADNEEHV